MKMFEKVTCGLDVSKVREELQSNLPLFDQYTARQDYKGTPHKDTKTIFLRWCKSKSVEAGFNDLEVVDYPVLKELPECAKLIEAMAKAIDASEVNRVVISSLKSGGIVDTHIDEGKYIDVYTRFHIPIYSKPRNYFYAEHNDIITIADMQEGSVWWINHKVTHWLENRSDSDRWHLIMDAKSRKYPHPLEMQ